MLLCSILMQNIQIFYWGPVMIVFACYDYDMHESFR